MGTQRTAQYFAFLTPPETHHHFLLSVLGILEGKGNSNVLVVQSALGTFSFLDWLRKLFAYALPRGNIPSQGWKQLSLLESIPDRLGLQSLPQRGFLREAFLQEKHWLCSKNKPHTISDVCGQIKAKKGRSPTTLTMV